jgi:4'-phosphopantetheinyl transferase
MNRHESQWRRSIPAELISSNEVHIWRAYLDLSRAQCESLLAILSVDELERASRFRFEKDQKRFIVARGMLRKILGHYLRKDPVQLRFDYAFHGKPVLATNAGYDHLDFNLSHSNAFAIYALTRGRNVGVDIECISEDVAIGQIAQRFFSPEEISSLASMDKARRSEVFFQYWARKEALLKAMGAGISFPMEQCDVSLLNGKFLSQIKLLGDHRACSYWYGQDLFPGNGYAAAIVVEGSDCNLSCWDYLNEA